MNDNNMDSILLDRAQAEALMAEAEALMAEAEAKMAEADAALAEAEAIKAEAEAMMAEVAASKKETPVTPMVDMQPDPPRIAKRSTAPKGNSEAISITTLKDKDKVPKEKMVLYPDEYEKLGIKNFRAVAIKECEYGGVASFMVNGEYDGRTKKSVVVVIMAFNASNELMGASFNEEFEENICGHKTYSASIVLPQNEWISRIEIRMIPDPVSWD